MHNIYIAMLCTVFKIYDIFVVCVKETSRWLGWEPYGWWRWEWHQVSGPIHPRDDELVLDYLLHMLSGGDVIHNKCEPWNLPRLWITYYCLLALLSSFISSQIWLHFHDLIEGNCTIVCILPTSASLGSCSLIHYPKEKKHTQQEQRFLYSVSEHVTYYTTRAEIKK
jgi:hypothetical protein